ncbi:hypothetical protein PsorP6_016630 [Peronosclerospora sorghi]|uniref:Uncharacterized protein n=1 Tax=Peronosclerospora sorghi TaxID=230839 RepID=A0ACC0VLH7_9STRA|nr:hypothetical protein PsorP6_016630 [Peronosclerospora sorghi]
MHKLDEPSRNAHFQSGTMSREAWKKIDKAYDLMCIEFTVRLTRYDPVIKEISPFTTPREYLLWGHRLLPILVFTVYSIKKVFFIDMEKHHQRILIHMLEKNMVCLALKRLPQGIY